MSAKQPTLTGYDFKERITGKIILTATLRNNSPLLLGSGLNDKADKEIIKLPDGTPYIPASAIAGKLRRRFKDIYGEEDISFRQFWGVDEDNGSYQSHIVFEDASLIGETFYTTVRDGVKIEHATNLAKDQGKYDYELLEVGHLFRFRAEITIRANFVLDHFKKMAGTVLELLQQDFRIGAHETSGFGEIECINPAASIFAFPTDATAWFNYLQKNELPTASELPHLETKQNLLFKIEATFALKTTFLTSAYGVKSNEPDKTQLKRRKPGSEEEDFILSGKALRGAIRHRGVRILNTISARDAESKIDELFGFVNENTKKAKKSKLRFTENVFSNSAKIDQTRIKIDRFTGGTISGALQESQPLAKGTIQLTIEIPDYLLPEAALLMFILKDLWTADLPIGGEKNIGRGVLQGVSGTVYMGDSELDLGQLGKNGYMIPEAFKNLTLDAWKSPTT
ncbi:MAG: RAMP superfamily CRISPR-associated protein [Spirosomataceae bacterium]